jgi:hypothetical protein
VVDPAPRHALPDARVLDLVRATNGEILVCDSTPVHLLLTRDGLFERRFALSPPSRGASGRVMGPAARAPRHFGKACAEVLDPFSADYQPPHPKPTGTGLEEL